jgi:pseudoazurin
MSSETSPVGREENLENFKMRKVMSLAAFALLMSASMTLAAEVEVKMLNKGAEGLMVFEPALVKIEPGDTVKFVASDKSHNAETIKGMLPAGAAPFAGKMNEDVVVTFDKPGVYGVKCMPHYAMGMVALVVVGKPDNLEEAKALPQSGKAKQVLAALFDRLAQQAAAK